jgi:hypothetical protein
MSFGLKPPQITGSRERRSIACRLPPPARTTALAY